MTHAGSYSSHDDDCRCSEADMFCNRAGSCWSCCGACKRDSECSSPHIHPTYCQHPRFTETFRGTGVDGRPIYLSNEAIRALFPDCFATPK